MNHQPRKQRTDATDYEEVLLGSLILAAKDDRLEELEYASEVLTSSSFVGDYSLGRFFQKLVEGHKSGQPIGEVPFLRSILDQNDLRKSISPHRLGKIITGASTNARHYVNLVLQNSQRHLVKIEAERLLEACDDASIPPDEIIHSVAGKFDELRAGVKVCGSSKSFAGLDVAELQQFQRDETDWLVSGVLAADQPTIVGAASKATKTSQLTDLAVALASGSAWMNHFLIPRKRRVLFITGESNQRACSKRIARALDARLMTFNDITGFLRVEAVDFPVLPSLRDQEAIRRTVERHGIEVVIIDPLYRGLGSIDTHRMHEVGAAIVGFSKAVQPASLIISHHVTKSSAKDLTKAPSLEDLSGAGLAESCGNWWLLGRNEPYQFNRMHDLVVQFGGRDEQAGIKRIVFNEADWTFEITNGHDLQEQRERERVERREMERQARLNEARAKVRHALANEKEPRPKSWIEVRSAGIPQATVREAISSLLNDGSVKEQTYLDGQNRQRTGLILA